MTDINLYNLLKNLEEHQSDDIEINREKLLNLIQVNLDLMQSLFNVKVELESWEYNFSTLIEKIVHESNSIMTLSKSFCLNGYKEKFNTSMIDSPSMFIISRSILECYLTLFYIYIEDIPKEERYFRFKLWEVSGVMTRQNANVAGSNFIKQRREEEKKLIEKWKNELINHPEYGKLVKSKLKKLNKYGLPRLDTWHQLINRSGLNKKFFVDIYNLSSNYAHSEYLSILQLTQTTRRIKDESNLIRVKVSFSLVRMINCLIIFWLKENFKSAEEIYNTLPLDIRNAVVLFKEIASGK